jgi:hypothetical protein
MQRYSKFRPTAFDSRGLGLPDRQDWFVVDVGVTRDSGPLSQSNFESAEAMLAEASQYRVDDGEADDFERHSFSHWGPGWFDILIVRPGSRCEAVAREIQASLEDYPVLDDEDFSRREWEEFEEGWENYAARDLVQSLRKDFGLSDVVYYFLEEVSKDDLREFWMAHANEPYFGESDGICIPTYRSGDYFERDDLAAFIREQRNKLKAPQVPV